MLKNIIIAVIIIAAIGLGIYFILAPVLDGKPQAKFPAREENVAPPVERHQFQGMDYEIISVGGPVYDIITGPLSEEQTKILAEKIIGDVIAENYNSEEITLLFYSDLIALGVEDVDVARVVRTKEGLTVTMVEK